MARKPFQVRCGWAENTQRPAGSGHRPVYADDAGGALCARPFDPVEALPKSAEFLRDLWTQFGNLGLAAAAYNTGSQRVRDWLAGKRTLPSETQTYVRIVTGHSAQEWARPEQVALAITIPRKMSCGETAKLVEKPPFPSAISPPKPTWIAQLIGDSSDTNAMTRFRQLQKKYQALLGIYEPVVIRTTLRARARTYLDQDSCRVGQPSSCGIIVLKTGSGG